VVTPDVNKKNQREKTGTEKKRNTRTTDFEPLHIIVISITTVTLFLLYIYTHSYLY